MKFSEKKEERNNHRMGTWTNYVQTDFKIFTSIPPRANVDVQREILRSWRLNGFTPVSVNGTDEASQLPRNIYDVEVETVSSSGKPRITEILSVIRKTKAPVAGIANADCRMIHYPGLAQSLRTVLPGKILYARRLETVCGNPTLVEMSHGFDAFFFDNAFINDVEDSTFRIGECWWDYWLPLRLMVNGAKMASIAQPILLHEQHAVSWSDEDWKKYGDSFWRDFKNWKIDLPMPPELESRLVRSTMGHEAGLIAGKIYRWLRDQQSLTELSLLPREYQEVESLLRVDYLIADNKGEVSSSAKPEAASWNALGRGVLRFFLELESLRSRFQRGMVLLRRQGATHLLRHIIQFGRH